MFRRKRKQSDFKAEINMHLEFEIERLKDQGLSEDDARMTARRAFGNVTQAEEHFYESSRWLWWDHLAQDVRFGLRTLTKNPGFTAVAVLTLALGIGATTAIFSVVNGVLLHALPYRDSSRLVVVRERLRKFSPYPVRVSAPDIGVIARGNRVFDGVAAFGNNRLNISGTGEPARIVAARVSANLFPMLGAAPILGRTFREEDNPPGHLVAILGYGLWQRQFGGDAGTIGRSLTLDGQAYTIVGIMPRGFEFPPRGMPGYDAAELWIPIAFTKEELTDVGDNFDWGVLARLRPGITLGQAQSDMDVLAEAVLKTWGPEAAGMGIKLEMPVTAFRKMVVGPVQSLLFLLLGAVGLLLLIACANVANLLLSRAAIRQKEMALRAALGARRGRVVRQLLTESLLLAILGGTIGLLAAIGGTRLLTAIAPENIPQVQGIEVDRNVLIFAVFLSIGTGLLFGVIPAFTASRTDLNPKLKERGRSDSAGHRSTFARNAFVVAQFATAFVLVIGAGLLIRSFVQAEASKTGVNAENVVTATLAFPPTQYTKASQVTGFFQELFQRGDATPGVESIGAATDLPTESDWDHIFTVEEHPTPSSAEFPDSAHALVMGDYFRALGVPLVRGRLFTPEEEEGKANVLLISAGMARRYWPGEDPVGKRVKWGPAQSHSPWLTVVGVVGDVKDDALDKPTYAHTYEPYLQACAEGAMQGLCNTLNVAVRATAGPTMIIAGLRSAVHAIDPAEPLTRVRMMQQVLESSIAPRRFNTFLLSVFAAAALFLAAIGLYGALAFHTTQRTHEIGIRLALGAQRGAVVRLVAGQGAKLALWGVGIGAASALALARLTASLLFGVTATDPLTFAGVAVVLVSVALIACYLPARRAANVDPMVALRHE